MGSEMCIRDRFGLLAVELAVKLTHDAGPAVSLMLSGLFFVISMFFVHRSFYGMRIRAEAAVSRSTVGVSAS